MSRRYICKWVDASSGNQCNLAFNERSNLKVHIRIHTKDKPYECKFCNKKFSVIGNRNDHQRRHEGTRPFTCPIPGCEKAFYRRYQLTAHGRSKQHRNIPQDEFSYLLLKMHPSQKHNDVDHVCQTNDENLEQDSETDGQTAEVGNADTKLPDFKAFQDFATQISQ